MDENNIRIEVKIKIKVKVKEEKKEVINKREIWRIRRVNVKVRLVIVDPGVLKLNLTPPSKFMLII